MKKLLRWMWNHKKITLVIMVMIIFIHSFILQLQPRLEVIMNQCVEELFQELMEKSIQKFDYEDDELYEIHRSEHQEITNIQFNTLKLNQILMTSLNTLNQTLDEVSYENGIRHQRIRSKDWIDYSVPVGSLFQSILWYGKGFELPIRIQILQNINGEIKTKMEPYGINATMITISLSLQLQAHVETYIGRRNVIVENELPLVMQVIHGQVPESYRTS